MQYEKDSRNIGGVDKPEIHMGNHEDEIQLFHVPEGYFEYLPGQIL